MNHTLRRALAILISILLALPNLAFAEGAPDGAALEPPVEELFFALDEDGDVPDAEPDAEHDTEPDEEPDRPDDGGEVAADEPEEVDTGIEEALEALDGIALEEAEALLRSDPIAPENATEVSDTEWAALQGAIDSAADGARIDLSEFAGEDGRITCPANGSYLEINKKITLDLNGCVLDRGLTSAVLNGYVIYISEDGNLTVEDSSPDVEHTYTDPISGEEVTVKGGVITGGNNDGEGGGVKN